MHVRIAQPVVSAAHRGGPGSGLGGGGGAVYLAVGDDVVAVTGPGTPEMPNGISLSGPVPDVPAGAPVHLAPERLAWTGGSISLRDAEVYDPTVRVVRPGPWLAERSRYITDLPGPDDPGLEGEDVFRRAIATLDVALAAEAAHLLTGRGGGLTPEGDDLLAAAAGTARALLWPDPWIRALALFCTGESLLPGPVTRSKWEMAPSPGAERTTRLSASLLRHAAEGRLIAPMLALLDPENDRWREAVDGLAGLGHSTGRAYLRAAALVMSAPAETD